MKGPAQRRRSTLSRIFVCQQTPNGLVGCLAERDRNGIRTRCVAVAPPEPTLPTLKELKGCPVVLLLPKSQYLVRNLSVPKTDVQDAQQMLKLEIEAQLPAELGAAEVSHHRLDNGDVKDTHQQYEAYIARRTLLDEQLDTLASMGLQPTHVLPSAVILRRVLSGRAGSHLLVVRSACGRLEVASMMSSRAGGSGGSGGSGGFLSVRSVEPARSGRLRERGLVESIRSLMPAPGTAPSTVVVGWIGTECPQASNGRLRFQDVTAQVLGEPSHRSAGGDEDPMPRLAATALLQIEDPNALRAANLLPSTVLSRVQQKALLRTVRAAAACLVCAVLLGMAALQTSMSRYKSENARLARRIAQIRVRANAIGRRIDQLKAVGDARATRQDLLNVLAGLHEATPQQVSYSRVQLNDDGVLELHGQGESLAQLVLLPDKLESTAMFGEVRLLDVGTSKNGAASIAECRIEAILVRETQP